MNLFKELYEMMFHTVFHPAGMEDNNVASLFVCSGFDVKKFAQRVVGDASKAKQELMSVADKKRIVPPQKLDKKHEGMLEKL
jgi:hypothetical protein